MNGIKLASCIGSWMHTLFIISIIPSKSLQDLSVYFTYFMKLENPKQVNL